MNIGTRYVTVLEMVYIVLTLVAITTQWTLLYAI
jgi:hypothetical protein